MSATSVWSPSFTTYNWEDYKVGQSLFQELDFFNFFKFYLEFYTAKVHSIDKDLKAKTKNVEKM